MKLKNDTNQKLAAMKGYARYSSMAVQMIIIIMGSTFGGMKLDARLQTKPLFIVMFSLAGVGLAIYLTIKDLVKKDKK